MKTIKLSTSKGVAIIPVNLTLDDFERLKGDLSLYQEIQRDKEASAEKLREALPTSAPDSR